MNTIAISGNLVRTPELLTSKSGRPYCRFTVAVHRPISNDARLSGTTAVDYIDCVCFDQQARFMAAEKSKGQAVGIEGALEVKDAVVQAIDAADSTLRLAYADGTPIMVRKKYVTLIASRVEGLGPRPTAVETPKAQAIIASPPAKAPKPRSAKTPVLATVGVEADPFAEVI